VPCNDTEGRAVCCVYVHAYMQSYPYVHIITRILDLQDIEKQDVNKKKKIEFQIK